MEKLNPTQQKHTFTNQKKCSTTQNNMGVVASYDIRAGNGESLFWFWHFTNLSLTYLMRHLPTYLQPRDPHGTQIMNTSMQSTSTNTFSFYSTGLLFRVTRFAVFPKRELMGITRERFLFMSFNQQSQSTEWKNV